MHLTAISTATRRASASLSAAFRYECNHLVRKSFARHSPIRSSSVFCSCVANLLEMPNAGFHYSVIGRRGWPSPASGHVLWYPLNDDASASKSEAVVPGVAAGRLLPCGVAPSVDYAVAHADRTTLCAYARQTTRCAHVQQTIPCAQAHQIIPCAQAQRPPLPRPSGRALPTLHMQASCLHARGLSFLRSGAWARSARRLRTRR
jgi:hypothetical protein